MRRKSDSKRGGQYVEHPSSDEDAGLHGDIDICGSKNGIIAAQVLACNGKQVLVHVTRGHDDGQVVGVVIGTGNNANRLFNTGFVQGDGLCAAANDGAFRGAGRRYIGLDQYRLYALE